MEKYGKSNKRSWWFAFNGSFSDGTNVTPGSGTEKCTVLTFGLQSERHTNSAAENPLGGNCFYNITAGDGSGSTQVLSFATIWVR